MIYEGWGGGLVDFGVGNLSVLLCFKIVNFRAFPIFLRNIHIDQLSGCHCHIL